MGDWSNLSVFCRYRKLQFPRSYSCPDLVAECRTYLVAGLLVPGCSVLQAASRWNHSVLQAGVCGASTLLRDTAAGLTH